MGLYRTDDGPTAPTGDGDNERALYAAIKKAYNDCC